MGESPPLLVDVSVTVTGEEVRSNAGTTSEVGFAVIEVAVEAEGLLMECGA